MDVSLFVVACYVCKCHAFVIFWICAADNRGGAGLVFGGLALLFSAPCAAGGVP